MLRGRKSFDEDGKFTIHGDTSGETYRRREDFKAAGCTWNGTRWVATKSQLTKLGIPVMIKVEVEKCHEEPQIAYVPEPDANVGNLTSVFCGMCDSRSIKKIIRIIPS